MPTTLRRVSYNALLDRQCMEESGQPNCDLDRMSYETNAKERQLLLDRGAMK